MARGAELVIKISGNSKKFRNELNKVERAVGKTTNKLEKLSVAASRGIAIGLAAIAAGAVSSALAFADFEASFTNVVTLLDEGSFATKTLTEGIDDLKKGILELRGATGESFDNLNKGLFDLISAGVDAEKAIETLAVATNLAIAGATDTSVAVDGLTSALNAFSLEADDAQAISEKFFTAQKFGKTTVEELSRGFGLVASTANAFGVSLDELLASVSAVTIGGVRTSQAYTGLAAIFANISKPTKDAADEAEKLGIEFNTTALRAQGFAKFLDNITESAAFNETSLERLFGSVEAVKTILALTANEGAAFTEILAALGDETTSTTTFQNALAAQMDTVAQRMKTARGEIDAVKVEIGEELLPATEDFIDFLRNDFVPFLRDDLIPALRFTLDAISALSGGIRQMTNDFKRFLGLEISSPFEELRDRIKADIQEIRAQFNLIGGLSIFGEELDAGEAARVESVMDDIADIMAQAREDEAAGRQQAQEDKIEEDAIERERIEEQRITDREAAIEAKAEQIAGLRRLIKPALDQEVKDKAKAEKDAVKNREKREEREKELRDTALTSTLDNLSLLVDEESSAAKAIFFAKKASSSSPNIDKPPIKLNCARIS